MNRRRRADHGFSLIEVLIALTLSSVIGGVIVAALITSMTRGSLDNRSGQGLR